MPPTQGLPQFPSKRSLALKVQRYTLAAHERGDHPADTEAGLPAVRGMTAATAPEVPWVFEGPDPEVGIFGDLVIHPCVEDVGEAVPIGVTTERGMHTVRIITRFQCPGCGAETTASDEQPREFFTEPGRE